MLQCEADKAHAPLLIFIASSLAARPKHHIAEHEQPLLKPRCWQPLVAELGTCVLSPPPPQPSAWPCDLASFAASLWLLGSLTVPGLRSLQAG
jgi:hypothetical protein